VIAWKWKLSWLTDTARFPYLDELQPLDRNRLGAEPPSSLVRQFDERDPCHVDPPDVDGTTVSHSHEEVRVCDMGGGQEDAMTLRLTWPAACNPASSPVHPSPVQAMRADRDTVLARSNVIADLILCSHAYFLAGSRSFAHPGDIP
jgi:hypothetical protein